MATKTPPATGMRVVVSREAFARGLTAVSRAIANKSPMPILSHVKIVVADSSITFTATDLEIGLEARVPAEVHGTGSVAVAARMLLDIVGKLPNADIDLTMPGGGHELTLRCARSKFTLRGLAATDFPQLPTLEDGISIALPVAQMLLGIRQTVFAAAGEDKAVISGVFVHLAEGNLAFAATDGYRLACRECVVEAGVSKMGVTVPRRAMDELAKQLGAAGAESVTICVATNQIALRLGDRYMTIRLIDGSYPNYRHIVPQQFEREAVIKREALLAAVERVAIMSLSRESHTIVLEFGPGELRLTADTSEMGNSDEALSIEFTGETMKIAFNADYLIDALKHIDSESLHVLLNGPMSPVILRPVGDDGQTMLVMPVNRL